MFRSVLRVGLEEAEIIAREILLESCDGLHALKTRTISIYIGQSHKELSNQTALL